MPAPAAKNAKYAVRTATKLFRGTRLALMTMGSATVTIAIVTCIASVSIATAKWRSTTYGVKTIAATANAVSLTTSRPATTAEKPLRTRIAYPVIVHKRFAIAATKTTILGASVARISAIATTTLKTAAAAIVIILVTLKQSHFDRMIIRI
jgi:hypothetical protein